MCSVGRAPTDQRVQGVVFEVLQVVRAQRGLLAPPQVPDQHLHPGHHAFGDGIELGELSQPMRYVLVDRVMRLHGDKYGTDT